MRVAVAGGTGTLGAAVARLLAGRGHEVVALSRRPPRAPLEGVTHRSVDLATGDRLGPALEGCEAVVDAVNGAPTRAGSAFLVDATRRLLTGAEQAGAGHLVLASIVGCDRVPLRYYRAKVEQETAAEQAAMPATVVRATQFHALVAGALAAGARMRLLPVPRALLQPIDHRAAARAVADAVEGGPRDGRVDVAGPEVLSARDLAVLWRDADRRRVALAPLPLPGRLGRALRDGALTNPDAAVEGSPTFADWLSGGGAA